MEYDQQLISRLYTRPYNPVKSTSDLVFELCQDGILLEVDIREIRASAFRVHKIDDETFYLCYQAAVMSI